MRLFVLVAGAALLAAGCRPAPSGPLNLPVKGQPPPPRGMANVADPAARKVAAKPADPPAKKP